MSDEPPELKLRWHFYIEASDVEAIIFVQAEETLWKMMPDAVEEGYLGELDEKSQQRD